MDVLPNSKSKWIHAHHYINHIKNPATLALLYCYIRSLLYNVTSLRAHFTFSIL